MTVLRWLYSEGSMLTLSDSGRCSWLQSVNENTVGGRTMQEVGWWKTRDMQKGCSKERYTMNLI